ncbi:MAG TPA: XrtA system polysaccharide deacetylase [Steroidobacteraceae bacterium]|jgi:polysaccharide deacetylase family protein (PEP-CTERM system associated)|nr:XrtA system polysaccharide deacetylase [Steroidobacteraceae bacterium]
MNTPPSGLVNAMTIDVEDYFHVSAFAQVLDRSSWPKLESRVERNTQRLLDLFDEHQVRMTFFVLGWVAERYPELIKSLHRRGHEVACHGLTHELVYKQTPELFRSETHRSKSLLEDLTGAPVRGYRAASYSITAKSIWALDILVELGFEYDSSIFPIHHDLYGMPGAPRRPHAVAHGKLLEIPLTTVQLAGQRLPCAGGGYFRLLPYSVFRWSLRRVNAEGLPAVFYMHPWEIDPGQPRIAAPLKSRFRHYTNLHRTESRLSKLLKEFRWGRMDEVFMARQSDGKAVLREAWGIA